MKTALMFSGGLDSACAWYILGKPDALYFGGPHGPARGANAGELVALDRMRPYMGEKLRTLEFDFRPFMRKGRYYLPRHQVCAMLAWAEGYDKVQFAWHAQDCSAPNRAAMADAIEKVVELQGFKVEFPVIKYSKAELVVKAIEAGAPADYLLASHSCVTSAKPCGMCRNCLEREAAFNAVGSMGGD